MFPLGNCDPTGLALGPGNDIAVNCEATAGAPLLLQILDKNKGNIVAALNAGGGDQLVYDAATNRSTVPRAAGRKAASPRGQAVPPVLRASRRC